MDFASLIGIVSGIILVIASLLIGGSIQNFVNLPGVMIVVGGTIAATLLTFKAKDVLASIKAAWLVFLEKQQDPNDTVATMIRLNDVSRKNGLLELNKIRTGSVFLRKLCNLLADGAEEDLLLSTMKIEIEALESRHLQVQDVFKRMGTYAPAFGMLGTIIGLIQMLAKLNNPASVGPAMAVALITTFYGSLLATMVFLPVAAKLRSRSLDEINNLKIIYEGVSSIHRGDDTYLIYEKLSSFIPTRSRRPIKRAISSNGNG
ncbi:MAG: motility protein A [bacterium]|nr:motility protein A [bacterium]